MHWIVARAMCRDSFGAAEDNFLQPDALQPLFSHLRDQYVQAKLAERGRFLDLRKSLAQLFAELRIWLEQGGKPEALRPPTEYPWLLRFFLCDAYGTQISPNYEWTGQRWRQDPRYLDHNWSWRPYFYRILAAAGRTAGYCCPVATGTPAATASA